MSTTHNFCVCWPGPKMGTNILSVPTYRCSFSTKTKTSTPTKPILDTSRDWRDYYEDLKATQLHSEEKFHMQLRIYQETLISQNVSALRAAFTVRNTNKSNAIHANQSKCVHFFEMILNSIEINEHQCRSLTQFTFYWKTFQKTLKRFSALRAAGIA